MITCFLLYLLLLSDSIAQNPQCDGTESCCVNDSSCLQTLCSTDTSSPEEYGFPQNGHFLCELYRIRIFFFLLKAWGEVSESVILSGLWAEALGHQGLLCSGSGVSEDCGSTSSHGLWRQGKSMAGENLFLPQPGETETCSFYKISCSNSDVNLAMAVSGGAQVTIGLLLWKQRLVQTKLIIHIHQNSDRSSEVTL